MSEQSLHYYRAILAESTRHNTASLGEKTRSKSCFHKVLRERELATIGRTSDFSGERHLRTRRRLRLVQSPQPVQVKFRFSHFDSHWQIRWSCQKNVLDLQMFVPIDHHPQFERRKETASRYDRVAASWPLLSDVQSLQAPLAPGP